MRTRFGSLLLVAAVLGSGCRDVPTQHGDVGPWLHEDHGGPGAAGPDLRSQNVKLLANVPRVGDLFQSDIAFAGRYAYAGNYGGFRVIDLADPEAPRVVSDVACNGAQGDVSVYGHLLFLSVDQAQTSSACDSEDSAPDQTTFEGLRLFDVSDPASPRHVASVATDCGSHTHTLVPDPANGRVLVYVSSYPGSLFSTGPACASPHGFISIVTVPLADPTAATVAKHQLDAATQPFRGYRACHDIAVFVALRRAAASCLSENQLWDITDPAAPQLLWRFDNAAVDPLESDIWHSAAFSWDGRVVAFGDESGGGPEARCADPSDPHGRIWFLDAATGDSLATYKIPRAETGPCTAHYFNFVPQPKGRKVLVSAWYTGGTSIVDVDALIAGATPAAAEIGYYRPTGARTWSSYWYNGFVVTNDMLRGVDVMLLSDNGRLAARKLPFLNPQSQIAVVP